MDFKRVKGLGIEAKGRCVWVCVRVRVWSRWDGDDDDKKRRRRRRRWWQVLVLLCVWMSGGEAGRSVSKGGGEGSR